MVVLSVHSQLRATQRDVKVKNRFLPVFAILWILVVFGVAPQAMAADYSTCANCHDVILKPNTDPNKFNLPKINDGTPKGTVVDKSTCVSCHNPNWVFHQGVNLTKVEVAKGVYGTFLGSDSPLKPASEIHFKHSGFSRMSSNLSCQRCHGAVSCQQCHNAVPHTDHYSGNPVNKLTNTPIVTPTQRVVDGQNRQDAAGNWLTYVDVRSTCATSECHQTLSGVIRVRTDGQGLCKNCHTVDKTGHGDLTLLHTTVLPVALNNPEGSQTVSCEGCHSNSLDKEHLNRNLKCNTCHGPAARLAVKEAVKNKRKGCFDCHVNPPTRHKQFHVANQSNQLAITPLHTNCNTCHGNPNVRNIINQVNTAIPNYSCLDCHQGPMMSPIHVASYDISNKMRVGEFHPACSSCHSKVDSTINALAKTASVTGYTCTDCHNGTLKPVLQPRHKAKMTVSATVYGQVYEITQFHKACVTCHGNVKIAPKISTLKLQSSYSCADCHNGIDAGSGNHNIALPVGLASEPNFKCGQCHDNDPTTAGDTDLVAEHIRRINPVTGQNYTCVTCHISTKAEVRRAILNNNKNCSACHTQGWHQDLTTPHTSSFVTNPTLQCSRCHSNVLSAKDLHPDAISGTVTIGGGPVKYKIFRGTDGINFSEVATGSVSGFTDNGLIAGTRYYYQVAAVDQAGNISAKSNVAYATAVVTPVAVKPTEAQYSKENNNGDLARDGGFTSLTPSTLTRLTDGRDSTNVVIKEDGSKDSWFFVRFKQEVRDAVKVRLKIRASWKKEDQNGNLLIYPYQSNGTAINTSGVINYKINNPPKEGNYITYTIDVTAAARTMDNFGFMKFRIKPGTDGLVREAYISEVEVEISGGNSATLPGNPGTPVVTGTGGDSTPPSIPVNLVADATGFGQINLTWTPSTDSIQRVDQQGQSNCLRCHDNTQSQIQKAITTGKANCDACHTTWHTNVQSVHVSKYIPDQTIDCMGCHTVTKAEFTNPNTKARHAVKGTSSLATGGTYVSPYTNTSILDCRNCHSANNGTYFGRILVKTYNVNTGKTGTNGDLCFLCHQFNTYSSNGTNKSPTATGFSGDGKNLHTISDHSGYGCQDCHSVKPHSQTGREHFIVLKGEATAGPTNTQTKFIHRTNSSYTKSDCSAGCAPGDHP
ncbi:MAG: cytochrome c3 family protein [Thermincolia bacterium]